MIRVFLVCLLVASPAFATDDAWPALYDVEGVAPDDVLNIRSAPEMKSAQIGTLPHDANNIEVIAASDAGTWGLVNTGEGSGWVSLAFLARQPGQREGHFPDVRQCFGTEPFWNIKIDPPRATFSSQDAESRDGVISGLHRSRNRRDRFVFTGAFFPDDFGVLDLELILRTEGCSDGMSDRAYGISVDLFMSGSTNPNAHQLLSGCCSISPP